MHAGAVNRPHGQHCGRTAVNKIKRASLKRALQRQEERELETSPSGRASDRHRSHRAMREERHGRLPHRGRDFVPLSVRFVPRLASRMD